VDLAQLCQRAENEFVQRCGIMDQFIALLWRAGKSLLADLSSLEYQLLPLPKAVRLIVCNTMVRIKLAGGEYNTAS